VPVPTEIENPPAKKDAARARIRDGAIEVLRTTPFRDLTVDRIMATTGISRSAFYHYYDDLSSLVVSVAGELGPDLYAVVVRWAEDGEDDFLAAMHVGVAGIVDFFQHNGPILQAVVDAAATHPEVDRAYLDFLAAYDRVIVRGLDGMITRGQLAPCDTVSLARALNLMGERFMLDSFGREPFADPASVRDTMELIWMRTIGPRQDR
jgi:AcrR family transcriptional regulator